MVLSMSVSARRSSTGVTPGSLWSVIAPGDAAARAVVVDGVVGAEVATGGVAFGDELPHPDIARSSTTAPVRLDGTRRMEAPLGLDRRRGYPSGVVDVA